MKLPEWMFTVINPVMVFLLQSPLHQICSDSIALVHFNGRKSGKSYVTPARYVRLADRVRLYSTQDTQWWKNLRNNGSARLTLGGTKLAYSTSVIENNPEEISEALRHYFSVYPQDAAYHEVKIGNDGKPSERDLEKAAQHAVVINAWPTPTH